MNVLLCYCLAQNLHWKLGRLTPSFGSILMVRIKKYFVRNKTFFVFQDRKLKLSIPVRNGISWNLTKFQLIQLIQIISIFIFSISYLIELNFSEDSRNSISNRCWYFQLSILKNKKSFIPKRKFCILTQFLVKVLLRTSSLITVFFVLISNPLQM